MHLLLLALLFHFSTENQKLLKFRFQKKILPIATFIVSILCFGFGWQKLSQEQQLFKLIEAKTARNNQKMLIEAEKINVNLFPADNSAVPITWYKGIAHFNLNQLDRARLNFELAAQENPYNFNVLNNLGTSYFLQKRYAEAEKLYLEAVRINPAYIDAKLNLVAVYINTQKFQLAKKWLDTVTVKSQRTETLRNLIP